MTSLFKHILLVQDDAPHAEAIVRALDYCSDVSFKVEWVRYCAEGLDRLADAAAILVDLYLPDSRGIETFDRFFRAAPHIPIMVLIDPEEEATAKLALQRGAQDCLFKDRLDSYLLPKALDSMIERAAISEALFEQKERILVTLNSIGDAVMSTDVSGRVTYLNVIAEGLTGWSQEQAVGHPLEEVFRIIDAGTREIAPNPMVLAIRENKPVALTPNCVLIRRDGVEAAIGRSGHGPSLIARHQIRRNRSMIFRNSGRTHAGGSLQEGGFAMGVRAPSRQRLAQFIPPIVKRPQENPSSSSREPAARRTGERVFHHNGFRTAVASPLIVMVPREALFEHNNKTTRSWTTKRLALECAVPGGSLRTVLVS